MANWTELTTESDWQSALEQSATSPIMVMKHSTTCPISANAWREFQKYLAGDDVKEDVQYYVVKVIESRPVSLQIAKDLDVTHQSPQVILVENRQATWSTSHYDITGRNIRSSLA